METGVFGHLGEPAVLLVEEVLNRDQESVTVRHQALEELLVMALRQIAKTVGPKHALLVNVNNHLQKHCLKLGQNLARHC